jgi:hypothetical protein
MDITTAWTELHNKLRDNGFSPTLHILDNKCSHVMKQAFAKHSVNFHRQNAAERAIQIWKNHFSAGIATCDPKFPLAKWDPLMPQADLTLNLLRSSRRYPKLSAHSCLNKAFNFLSTPLAPPGIRVVAHITPSQRANMAPHGVDGWYVGPSLNHYQCHQCYIPSTSQSWNVLTVDWFPHTVPFPKVDTDDYLRQTANNMLSLLHSRKEHQSPLAFRSTTKNVFIQIAQILRRANRLPIPPPLTPVPEPRVVQAPPIAANIPPVTQPRVVAPPSPPKPVLPTPPPTAATTKPQPITRPTTGQARLPTRHLARNAPRPARYSARAVFRHKYAHHTAALATTPIAGK